MPALTAPDGAAYPESVDAPDRTNFKSIVDGGRPVLFRNIVRHWPAVSRWSFEYAARVAGTRRVPVEFYPEGSYYGRWLSFETTLHRYLELSTNESSELLYYLAEVRLYELLPELASDIEMPPFIDPAILKYSGLFLGRDTVTGMHYHATDQALLCQIRGKKRIILYPPEDFGNLYFDPWYSHRFNFSPIDFGKPDPARFPKLSDAKPLFCTLQPGDALFIPMHWGHVVEGEGDNASVTFFWKSRLRHWALRRVSAHAIVGHQFRAMITRPLARFLTKRLRCRVMVN